MKDDTLKDRVKAAARGRWREILCHFGFPRSSINGLGHRSCPHPRCPDAGGKDRFRPLDDVDDCGAVYCNQCFSQKNGDGLAAIGWLNGWTFKTTLRAVAEYLNIRKSRSASRTTPQTKPVKPKRPDPMAINLQSEADPVPETEHPKVFDELRRKFSVWGTATEKARERYELAKQEFANNKPPITPASIDAVGGLVVTYPVSADYGNPCIAIPAYAREGEAPAAWVLRKVDGTEFPEFKTLKARKAHTLQGSTKAWIIAGGFEQLRRARYGLRVEGEADLLAVYSLLPNDWVAFTNSCGANAVPDNIADIVSGMIIYCLGDADVPGQNGAIKFLAAAQPFAESVKHIELPYAIEPTHGKDLRDYLNEGNGFDELRAMCDVAPVWMPEESRNDLASAGNEHLDRISEVLAAGIESLYRDTDILKALATEAIEDPPAYAAHREILRSAGVRMRDFDTAMRHIVHDARRAQSASMARDENGGFFIDQGSFCREKITADGPVTIPICNFTAEIIDETIRDDGVEQHVVIGVQGQLASTGKILPRVEVSSAVFATADRWITQSWGTDPIIWPGELRTFVPAMQALSKNKARQTVYSHIGWRELNGVWSYLHAGGAIASGGANADVSVHPDAPLDKFILPVPPTGEHLKTAVRASLSMILVAPNTITIPMLAAVYRSIIAPCDFSLFLAGLTGIGKSEIAALAQQHFGAGLDARHLPGSWSSTENSLEAQAFAAKDAVFVADDFIPGGNSNDAARYHQKADRVLRAQGNASGRQRMRPDGSLRPAKPPRGLIVSTGEDVPVGHSLRARMFIVEMSRGDVRWDRLTKCQQDAAQGLYSQSLAGFIQWIAGRYLQLQKQHRSHVEKIRDEVGQASDHARTPSLVAELLYGWRTFLEFAVVTGSLSESSAAQLSQDGKTSLLEVAAGQLVHHEASNPVLMFVRLIGSAIASGAAHIADTNGDAPKSAERWGWRFRTFGTGAYEEQRAEPQGKRIGWVDKGGVYLEPAAAFSVAQAVATSHGRTIPVTEQTLWKRMKEHSPAVLGSWDATRNRNTIRKTICSVRREVIHLLLESLSVLDDDAYDTDDQGENGIQENDETETQLVHLEQLGRFSARDTPSGGSLETIDSF